MRERARERERERYIDRKERERERDGEEREEREGERARVCASASASARERETRGKEREKDGEASQQLATHSVLLPSPADSETGCTQPTMGCDAMSPGRDATQQHSAKNKNKKVAVAVESKRR